MHLVTGTMSSRGQLIQSVPSADAQVPGGQARDYPARPGPLLGQLVAQPVGVRPGGRRIRIAERCGGEECAAREVGQAMSVVGAEPSGQVKWCLAGRFKRLRHRFEDLVPSVCDAGGRWVGAPASPATQPRQAKDRAHIEPDHPVQSDHGGA
jgi:hypothetical protein